jgi:hypothetical protein
MPTIYFDISKENYEKLQGIWRFEEKEKVSCSARRPWIIDNDNRKVDIVFKIYGKDGIFAVDYSVPFDDIFLVNWEARDMFNLDLLPRIKVIRTGYGADQKPWGDIPEDKRDR